MERPMRRHAAAVVTMLALFAHVTGAIAEWITTAPGPSMVSPDNTYLVPSSPDGGYVSKRALTAAAVENAAVNEQVREINARRAAELDTRGGDWCKTHEHNSLASTLRCASRSQGKELPPLDGAHVEPPTSVLPTRSSGAAPVRIGPASWSNIHDPRGD